jgi:hypothetical protein
MTPSSPAETILDEVTAWDGITTQATPRGATAIMFDALCEQYDQSDATRPP